MAIFLNASDNKVRLLLGEELQAETLLGGKLGEVDNGEEGDDGNCAGNDALEDENPSPPCDTREDTRLDVGVGLGRSDVSTKLVSTTMSGQQGETVSEDTAES